MIIIYFCHIIYYFMRIIYNWFSANVMVLNPYIVSCHGYFFPQLNLNYNAVCLRHCLNINETMCTSMRGSELFLTGLVPNRRWPSFLKVKYAKNNLARTNISSNLMLKTPNLRIYFSFPQNETKLNLRTPQRNSKSVPHHAHWKCLLWRLHLRVKFYSKQTDTFGGLLHFQYWGIEHHLGVNYIFYLTSDILPLCQIVKPPTDDGPMIGWASFWKTPVRCDTCITNAGRSIESAYCSNM